tara:strand:+ start:797 stop:1174 length:378 start_codon:yes stop_codon:yes gene_type:complete
MPIMEFPFSQTINSSVQIGDTLYYVSTESVGVFNVATPITTMIGVITNIEEVEDEETNIMTTVISANIDDETPPPQDGDFLFFSKDNVANLTSILGYYGKAKFKNNSREKAELFASACGVEESSK